MLQARRLVFPNSPAKSELASCCTKLSFSNVGRIVKRVAKSGGLTQDMTSRILRRSQITALWEKDADPVWRQDVATLAGHSLDTARRYYEYSDRVKPTKRVYSTLDSMRSETAK